MNDQIENYELDMNNIPVHIAFIMDGNGRWAKKRMMPRTYGHNEGTKTIRKIALEANRLGVKAMTVYAFSTENWKRSEAEVKGLMLLLKAYVEKMLAKTNSNNIKINILGDISKLDISLQKSINRILDKTKENTGLTLNIAFNYGGRDEIVKATQKISEEVKKGNINVEDIDEKMVGDYLYTKGQPDPDIMIRTSGELRLSNFLLWQLAYTEFVFLNKYWPDFNEKDLDNAVEDFQKRHRNFGAN